MNLIPLTIKDYLHQLYKKSESKDHQLLYLFLEITRLCNLNCKHCGSDCSSKTDITTLTTDSWLKIINDLAESFVPTPTIVLTGGEPILHWDFQKIIQTLYRLKMRWGIVSNGYSLSEDVLEIFLQNHIHSITISLDGTESTHNWLRNKDDAYSKTIYALNLLEQANIMEKDVVTCVHPKNINELDELAEILVKLRVQSWRLFRIFPAGRAKKNKQLLLSNSQTRYLLEWITENRTKYSKHGLELNYSCEGWLPLHIDFNVRKHPFFCRAGINIGSILCDGTITGCTNNFERFFEGSVLEDSFSYIWQNKFKQFRNRTWLESTDCGRCHEKNKCQGSSIHLWRENLKRPEICYLDCYQ